MNLVEDSARLGYSLSSYAEESGHLTPELFSFFDRVGKLEVLKNSRAYCTERRSERQFEQSEDKARRAILEEFLKTSGYPLDVRLELISTLLDRVPGAPPPLFSTIPSATLRVYLDVGRLNPYVSLPGLVTTLPHESRQQTHPAARWPLSFVATAAYTARGPYLTPDAHGTNSDGDSHSSSPTSPCASPPSHQLDAVDPSPPARRRPPLRCADTLLQLSQASREPFFPSSAASPSSEGSLSQSTPPILGGGRSRPSAASDEESVDAAALCVADLQRPPMRSAPLSKVAGGWLARAVAAAVGQSMEVVEGRGAVPSCEES